MSDLRLAVWTTGEAEDLKLDIAGTDPIEHWSMLGKHCVMTVSKGSLLPVRRFISFCVGTIVTWY